MIIAYTDQNDCNFAIKLLDDSKEELTTRLIKEGMRAWYDAGTAKEPTEHFSVDDINSFEQVGYAEPSCELLDRFEIPYEDAEIQYDEDENIIADVLL